MKHSALNRIALNRIARNSVAALALAPLALVSTSANAASEICFAHSGNVPIHYHVHFGKKEAWRGGGSKGTQCISVEDVAPAGTKVTARISAHSRTGRGGFYVKQCPGEMAIEPLSKRRVVFNASAVQLASMSGLGVILKCNRHELNEGEFTPLAN